MNADCKALFEFHPQSSYPQCHNRLTL